MCGACLKFVAWSIDIEAMGLAWMLMVMIDQYRLDNDSDFIRLKDFLTK
jgi:hypothetical protein